MLARCALCQETCADAGKDNDSDAQSALNRDRVAPNDRADDCCKDNARKGKHGAHKQIACTEAARHGYLCKACRQPDGNDARRAFERVCISGFKKQVPSKAEDEVEK